MFAILEKGIEILRLSEEGRNIFCSSTNVSMFERVQKEKDRTGKDLELNKKEITKNKSNGTK